MEFRQFGSTGLKVSSLGLGLSEIGGLEGDSAVKDAGILLNSALDAGINFLDTAECYGRSEELIGQTVSHRRDDYILATKAGHSVAYDPNIDYSSAEPWTPRTILENIENSLIRMKTDHVDLIQLHAHDLSAPPSDDLIQIVLDAKSAGKTRFVGYSQENEHAKWALKSGIFDSLQTAFSIVDQRARYELLDLASDNGIAVIAKRPIGNNSWGKVLSGLQTPSGELQDRAKAMIDVAPIQNMIDDPIELALGFILAHSQISTAIVGTRNPLHLLSNIKTIESCLPLAREILDELHERFDRVGAEWRGFDSPRSLVPPESEF